MSIPPTLHSILGEKRFWLAYLRHEWFERSSETLLDVRVELRPVDGYCLALTLSEATASLILGFGHSAKAASVEIGSVRAGRCCGNVLRWDQLDRIARAVSLRDSDWTHPGLATLLLIPFAPIRPGDDVDLIFPLLEAAFRSLNLFSEGEIDDLISRLDRRREAIVWRTRDPQGWVLDLADKISDGFDHEGFSTQFNGCEGDADPGDFPHEDWSKMLDAARRVCRDMIRPEWLLGSNGRIVRVAAVTGDLRDLPSLADGLEAAGCQLPAVIRACRNPAQAARACLVVELLAKLEPGMVIRPHFGPATRQPRPFFSIQIYVPISRTTFEADRQTGPRIRAALRRAIREGDEVEIRHDILFEAVGVRREVEGIEHYLILHATTWSDPAPKVAAVHQVLLAAGPPVGTRLWYGEPRADGTEAILGDFDPGG